MMKICLINVPNTYELVGNDPVIIKDQQGVYPPLGLLYMAAYLKDTGRYEVKVIDCQENKMTHAECADAVKEFNPDLVGLTAMTFTLVDVKLTVQEIRKRVKTKIVIGGPHTAIYPEECFSEKGLNADYVVVGEGEKTLDKLAQDIKMGKAFTQIYRQTEFIEHLDDLPFAARELTNIENYYSVLSKDTPTTTMFSCHDDQTEVLTESGFKLFKDVCHKEKLLTYNLDTGIVEPKNIKGLSKDKYHGKMYHFKSATMDCMVTPNHRMMVQKRNGENYTEFQFELAEKTVNKFGRRFTRFGEWIGDEPSNSTVDIRTGNCQKILLKIPLIDYLEFLGYYLSEGNSWFLRNNRNRPMYRTKITQSFKKHPEEYKRMQDCISRIGLKCYKTDTQFEISCKDLYLKLKPLGLCHQKFIPTYFKTLTRPYLQRLFNAMIDGDGYLNKNGTYHYTTTSKQLADDFQEISLKLGYGSTVHKRNQRSGGYIKGRLVQSSLPCYTVTSYKKSKYLTPHGPKNVSEVFYDGYVYCAETENQTLITRRNGRVITLGNSRGCPFSCTYCDRPALGKGFRPQGAMRVVNEMEHCEKALGIKEIFFYDDTFSVSMRRVNDICDEYLARGLTIKWDVRTRVNVVNRDLLIKMKKAGCERIHFGIESGVERIRKEMQKGITNKQIYDAFDACREIGMKTLAYFMLGNRTETFDDVKATLAMAKRVKPDFMQMTILSPFPATKDYQIAQQRGVIKGDPWRDYAKNINDDFRPPLWTEIYTRSELEAQLRWFYSKFYLNPKFVWERIKELRNWGQFKRYASAGISLLKMSLVPESKLKDSWRIKTETDTANSSAPEAAVSNL